MNKKESNPKDVVGVRKWRQFCTIPLTVIWEVGVAMLEGARKYGRHNYRVVGVRASVYVDAAMGHIGQYWEGEDNDPDTTLSHITKAIASLVVLRDAQIQGCCIDDRPPATNLKKLRSRLQESVDDLFDRYPDPVPPYTEEGEQVKYGEELLKGPPSCDEQGNVAPANEPEKKKGITFDDLLELDARIGGKKPPITDPKKMLPPATYYCGNCKNFGVICEDRSVSEVACTHYEREIIWS